MRWLFHYSVSILTHGSNLSVYNNPKDSDIILKCGDHQFYAHRAILRLWSPFFERSLNSGFSVAKSAIFNIDQEDPLDHEYFGIMLKHIYGMPFGGEYSYSYPYRFEFCSNTFENIIRVFIMADKYDIPSVRIAAISEIEDFLYSTNRPEQDPDEDILDVSEWIAKICGPDAPQLADSRLRDVLSEWVTETWDVLFQNPHYTEKIEDGSLLDTDLTANLLFNLGAEIKSRKNTQGRKARG